MTGVSLPMRWGLALGAVAAVLAAIALGTVWSVDVAHAHGTCTNGMAGPLKNGNGRIIGSNRYTCQYQHMTVKACVAVEFKVNGVWESFGEAPHRCDADGPYDSDNNAVVSDSRACAQTGYYRLVGTGKAINSDTVTVHEANDTGAQVLIQCNTGDLTSVGGVFDDVNSLIGPIGN
jgi:hypothetical protein